MFFSGVGSVGGHGLNVRPAALGQPLVDEFLEGGLRELRVLERVPDDGLDLRVVERDAHLGEGGFVHVRGQRRLLDRRVGGREHLGPRADVFFVDVLDD